MYAPSISLAANSLRVAGMWTDQHERRMERGPRGFQTALDDEHGLRLLDCRMVEYYSSFVQ